MASLLSTPWTFTVARFARSPNSHQQGPRGRGKHSRQPTGARAREPDPGRRSGPVRRHSGRREAENSTADVQNDRRAGAKSGIGRRTGCHSPPEIGSLRRGRGGCLFRLEDVVKIAGQGSLHRQAWRTFSPVPNNTTARVQGCSFAGDDEEQHEKTIFSRQLFGSNEGHRYHWCV